MHLGMYTSLIWSAEVLSETLSDSECGMAAVSINV